MLMLCLAVAVGVVQAAERPAPPRDQLAPTFLLASTSPAEDPALIREAQEHLKQLGYFQGEVDGVLGRETTRAISQFRINVGRKASRALTPELVELLRERARQTTPQGRLLARQGQLEAYAGPGRWCRGRVRVTLQAPAPTAYRQGSEAFDALLAQLRAVLQQDCPRAKQADLVGMVESARVYVALLDSSGALKVRQAPTSLASRQAIGQQQVAADRQQSACAKANPQSYDQVLACMASARWSHGLSAGRNRFEGNIGTSSCRTIALTYATVLNELAGLARDEAEKRMPSCEIFARAAREIGGKPVYWQACIGHGSQPAEAHMARCLEGFIPGYYGAATAVTQKVTGCATAIAEYERGLAAASTRSRLPDDYRRPSCEAAFAMIAGWTGTPALAAGCVDYDPDKVAVHLEKCLAQGLPLTSLRTCQEVRSLYETLLVEAHGGLPQHYRMLPCFATADLLARAEAERAEVAERKRLAALEEQRRRAEIQAARNRAINEKARQAKQRYERTVAAGDGPLVTPTTARPPGSTATSDQRGGDAVLQPTIAFDRYEQAGVLDALLQGRFDALQANRFGVIVYISRMHHTFSDELMEVDPRCTLLTSAEMDRGLANTALEVAGMGSLDRPASREQMVEAGLEALLGAVMMYQEGPQGMMRQGMNQELLKQQGRKDAIRLATELGCDDEVTEKLYENAKRFVLRQAPE